MKSRKFESQRDIPNGRDPKKVLSPKFVTLKKQKSDLTLGSVDSSDYVRTLASQSKRAEKIDRMRQNAVSNQRAIPESRFSTITATKLQLKAIKKLAGDQPVLDTSSSLPTKSSHKIPKPLGSRLGRTMTPGSFKKRYSSKTRPIPLGGKTPPNAPNTLPGFNSFRSQFSLPRRKSGFLTVRIRCKKFLGS